MSDESGHPPGGPPPSLAAELLDEQPETSLLDLVDSLLDRGVLTRGEAVIGLAGVDLIYLRLSALLCAADRVLPAGGGGAAPQAPAAGTEPAVESRRPEAGPSPPASAASGRPATAVPASGSAMPPAVVAAAASGSAAAGEPEPAATEPSGSALPPGSSTPGSPAAAEPPPDDLQDVHPLGAGELDALRGELETRAASPARWNADPENAQRAVAKLVLTLVDFLRQLMERQAIRRMEAGTVTDDEVERLGLALMRLEETLHEMAARFGIPPEDLNLDLGPLGRLT